MSFMQLLAYVGAVETIVLLIGMIWGLVLWLKGILPALWRLGNGLAKRKITIFASLENYQSLENLLTDSKLFNRKNISVVSKSDEVGRAEDSTLFLVHWHDCSAYIDEILKLKTDKTALVVYSPRGMDFIPNDQMDKLETHRNTSVTNFRGRLLNDVITSLITTSYAKK